MERPFKGFGIGSLQGYIPVARGFALQKVFDGVLEIYLKLRAVAFGVEGFCLRVAVPTTLGPVLLVAPAHPRR